MCMSIPQGLLCKATVVSVLQCVAVRCSALQCVIVCCSTLQCSAVCCIPQRPLWKHELLAYIDTHLIYFGVHTDLFWVLHTAEATLESNCWWRCMSSLRTSIHIWSILGYTRIYFGCCIPQRPLWKATVGELLAYIDTHLIYFGIPSRVARGPRWHGRGHPMGLRHPVWYAYQHVDIGLSKGKKAL